MAVALSELKRALRALARTRWSTGIVVATIAVGVGGVAAVFGVVSALALRSLPYERASEIVTIDVMSSKGFYISTSIPYYRDWKERTRIFSTYGASAGWNFRLTGRDVSEVLFGQAVLGDFFSVFRVRPQLGRVFTANETEPGSPPLVILSYATWQRMFGGDAGIIGTSIALDTRPHTIVGVLPADFSFVDSDDQVYVNMGSIPDLPWEIRGSSFGTRIFARVRTGTPFEVAARDVERAGREVREREGTDVAMPSLRTLHDYVLGDAAKQLWLLLAAVSVVFVIALANVGGLVIARALDRQGDTAVRLALGGSGGDLRRLFMVEHVLMLMGGALFGLVIAAGLVRALVRLLPSDVPAALVARVGLDAWTVLGVLAVAIVAGPLFGLLAARYARPRELARALRGSGRGVVHTRRGARGVLVVAETALSIVLVVTAVLLTWSYRELQQADKGFDATNVLTARVSATDDEFPTREQWQGFYDAFLERTKALPGVTSAAISLLVPLSQRSWEMMVQREGADASLDEGASVLYNIVTPEYFTTLGVPIRNGRPFTTQDDERAPPVAVIDETMAARFWPGESAIGKRVTIGEKAADSSLIYRTVVGVSANVRHYTLAEPSRVQIYIPMRQRSQWGNGLVAIVRGTIPPEQLVTPLRGVAAAIDSRVPVWSAVSAGEYLSRSIAGERAIGVITLWLAVVASMVTAVGLFGVVSYAIVQRRREIALRMALGASERSVVALMTWNGVGLAALGVAIGLALSFALSRVLAGFVFGVSATSVVVYVASALGLLAISTLAALLPALGARRFAPATVLREE